MSNCYVFERNMLKNMLKTIENIINRKSNVFDVEYKILFTRETRKYQISYITGEVNSIFNVQNIVYPLYISLVK